MWKAKKTSSLIGFYEIMRAINCVSERCGYIMTIIIINTIMIVIIIMSLLSVGAN